MILYCLFIYRILHHLGVNWRYNRFVVKYTNYNLDWEKRYDLTIAKIYYSSGAIRFN